MINNCFWLKPNQKTDKCWCKLLCQHGDYLIIPLHNLIGAGCSGIKFKIYILMEKCVPQNGYFFIRFVTFTSTLDVVVVVIV